MDKHNVANGFRWARDEAGAFLSTFWMILALYGLGMWLVWSFFQIDAQFSRPLAGDIIPPEVTQHLAWAVRGFSIIVGMAIIWCHRHDMPKFRNLLAVLGAIAAVLLFLHAYGVAAKIMKGQYANADVITEVLDVNTFGVSEQITTLQGAKAEWRADTARVVESNQAAIENITSDGVNNDDQADAFRAANTAAQSRLSAKIDEADAKIEALQAASLVTKQTATTDAKMVDAFNPLFVLMARVSSWTWNPDIEPPLTDQFVSGILFFTLFFGFGEMLMMTLFTVAFAMLLVAREEDLERRSRAKYSGAVPDGMVDIRMTEAEWQAYEDALAVHDNIKDGAQKGARTRRRGKKIRQGDEYSREIVEIFMKRRRNGETMDNILQSRGLTPGEFVASYAKYIESDDERELLLGEVDEAFEDEMEPEPEFEDEPDQLVNGEDHDDTPTKGADDESAIATN